MLLNEYILELREKLHRKLYEAVDMLGDNYDSTCVHDALWNPNKTMLIQFKKGHVYAYYGVPKPVFLQFKNALSKGKLFWHLIRGKYEFKRVK